MTLMSIIIDHIKIKAYIMHTNVMDQWSLDKCSYWFCQLSHIFHSDEKTLINIKIYFSFELNTTFHSSDTQFQPLAKSRTNCNSFLIHDCNFFSQMWGKTYLSFKKTIWFGLILDYWVPLGLRLSWAISDSFMLRLTPISAKKDHNSIP